MTPTSMHNGNAIALEYLQHVAAMQHELQTATDAITRNSLAEFEQSLWQQEMLATCMRRNLTLLRVLHLDSTLLQQIRNAIASLQQATCVYKGLIGQCSHTASLLRSVCTLHGQPSSSTTSGARTLLCEA